jgi:hypothetical protein
MFYNFFILFGKSRYFKKKNNEKTNKKIIDFLSSNMKFNFIQQINKFKIVISLYLLLLVLIIYNFDR